MQEIKQYLLSIKYLNHDQKYHYRFGIRLKGKYVYLDTRNMHEMINFTNNILYIKITNINCKPKTSSFTVKKIKYNYDILEMISRENSDNNGIINYSMSSLKKMIGFNINSEQNKPEIHLNNPNQVNERVNISNIPNKHPQNSNINSSNYNKQNYNPPKQNDRQFITNFKKHNIEDILDDETFHKGLEVNKTSNRHIFDDKYNDKHKSHGENLNNCKTKIFSNDMTTNPSINNKNMRKISQEENFKHKKKQSKDERIHYRKKSSGKEDDLLEFQNHNSKSSNNHNDDFIDFDNIVSSTVGHNKKPTVEDDNIMDFDQLNIKSTSFQSTHSHHNSNQHSSHHSKTHNSYHNQNLNKNTNTNTNSGKPDQPKPQDVYKFDPSLDEKRKRLNNQYSYTDRLKKGLQIAEEKYSKLIDKWTMDPVSQQPRTLPILLSTLHQVVWDDLGWEEVSIGDLLSSAQIKKTYYVAIRLIHPDKIKNRYGEEDYDKIYLSNSIQDILNKAWREKDN